MEHVVHSIPPVYDAHSRVLVLGSLPSPLSRQVGFYYGNPHNRFWRVLALLAGEAVPQGIAAQRDFCLRHHIALWDVVAECDIEGAADASIANAQANDLGRICNAAPIEAVFCTGAAAAAWYARLGCERACGMPATQLPSTSPANAAWRLPQLVEAYRAVVPHLHPWQAPTLDVPAVVELEGRIAAAGTPLAELMCRAGAALAHAARVHLLLGSDAPYAAWQPRSAHAPAPLAGNRVVVLCGTGNNGGDGWVAAAQLAQDGAQVVLVTPRQAGEVRAQPAADAAKAAMHALQETEAQVLVAPTETELADALAGAHVIIDALLGTGFAGETVKEPLATYIRVCNTARVAGSHVIAADVPSGVSAQTGAAATPHVQADETITMITRKPGLTTPAAGKVSVASIAYIEPYCAQAGLLGMVNG